VVERREPSPFEIIRRLVKRIPRGRVATYGQLSKLIDGRLSPVAVGWALHGAGEDALPWHRVINARGGISTDGEHPGLQRALLESEGVRFDEDGRVDLRTHQWVKAAAGPRRRRARRRP